MTSTVAGLHCLSFSGAGHVVSSAGQNETMVSVVSTPHQPFTPFFLQLRNIVYAFDDCLDTLTLHHHRVCFRVMRIQLVKDAM